ncbi:MAG: peptidyl-prolyl cis-trans isomerase [Asticcacaulis sp.]
MISAFRAFTKSFAFKILMALLVLSFAVFGMNDVFRGGASNNVIEAGPRHTSAADFKRTFDLQKASIEERAGRPVSYEELVKEGVHQRYLSDLANDDSLYGALHKAGIRPSPALIASRIQKYPVFFDSITGRFDRTQYQSFLRQQGLNENRFEQIISDEMAGDHFGTAVAAGFKPPRIYAALQTSVFLETRETNFVMLTPDSVENPGQPNEAQLKAFYEENKERLRLPERRQFTLARFSVRDYTSKVTIDEEALKSRFEFRKDSLSTPETRSFVQITVPDQATGQKVIEALKKGEAADAIAKANKGTSLTYDAKPKSAVADRKVGDAAFALKEGETSGVVQGDLGLAVVRVNAISLGATPSYESVRDQLATEYREEQAKELLYKQVTAFEDERSKGLDVLAAAKKLGIPLMEMPVVTAEGETADGQRYTQFPQILKAAFEQPKGGETDVTDLGNGEYYALRVTEIYPSELPPLDKVKTELAEAWQIQEWNKRVSAKADEVAEKLRKGEDITAVATAAKGRVEKVPALDRQSAGQSLGPQLSAQIFNAKSGEVFKTPSPDGRAYLVGKLEKITRPAPEQINQVSAMVAPQLAQGLFADIGTSSRNGARTQLKTRIYPQNAVKALGLSEDVTSEAAK